MKRGAEIVARVGQGFALYDDGVGRLEEGAKLVLKSVEVDFTVVEPL